MGKGNTDPNRPSKQDYETPPEFMAFVERAFGVQFVLDLAGAEDKKKAPFVLTEEIDSLKQDWNKAFYEACWRSPECANPAAWLNPPFGRVDPWAQKCRMFSAGQLYLLVPAAIATRWFLDYCNPHCAFWGVTPRIPFLGGAVNPKTGKPNGIDRDMMLCQFGTTDRGWRGELRWKESTRKAKKVLQSDPEKVL
jgi:hypothetical protein